MDKVVHFEIPADSPERAKKFYEQVFGWKMNPYPEADYTILHTVEIAENNMPKEAGAINGGMMKRAPDIRNPVVTINVQNIDEALKRIEQMGGKRVRAKMKVGEMGFAAYFRDTEGNIMGLWETAR